MANRYRTEENKLNQITSSSLRVVFVLGGPGSGKGTQCTGFVEKYKGVQHLSVGDVLRAEQTTPGSEYAEIIAENMRLGRIGPMEMSTKLLHKAMNHAASIEGTDTFLVDGFPRRMDQLRYFENNVCPAVVALFLDCPPDIRCDRLLERGKNDESQRQDDDLETIKKRFLTFDNTSMEVVEHLDRERRLLRVDASQKTDKVFADFEKAMRSIAELEERSGVEGGFVE